MAIVVDHDYVANDEKLQAPPNVSMPGLVAMRALRAPHDTIAERSNSLGSRWLEVSCSEFMDQIRTVGAGLVAGGVQEGDTVAIMASTCYEWTIVDLAIQAIGAVVVPIYESSSLDQIAHILSDAGCRWAVTKDRGQAALVAQAAGGPDALAATWVIDEGDVDQLAAAGLTSDVDVDARIASLGAEDLATIVYTSGTTGHPRGVELTHGNLAKTALNTLPFVAEILRDPQMRILLFLPLAHIYARLACYLTLVGEGRCGHVPDARHLVADMAAFRPTTIGAVPRVLEKVHAAARGQAASSPIKRLIFAWCERVAIARARRLQDDREETLRERAAYRLARALVFTKLEARLGGNLRYVISGGAALNPHIERFFTGMGVHIHQGYGLTETTGPVLLNTPTARRIGTVGRPCPEVKVRVAEDGELQISGPGVFRGYHANPQATAEATTPDGWFRSGDLATIDADGFVTISGRKKELIVTAGGKNVQPAIIEDRIRTYPLVSQVVAVGEGRPFIGALLTLDVDALPAWLDAHKLGRMDPVTASRNPRIHEACAAAIARANTAVSRAESVRKFTILPVDFTEANGLLTPSLKVRRAQVAKHFAAEIAALYGEGASPNPTTDVPA